MWLTIVYNSPLAPQRVRFAPQNRLFESAECSDKNIWQLLMYLWSELIDEKEGLLVEQGDVLFTIKSTDCNLQEEQLVKSKQSFEKTVSQNERLVKSIKDDTNYFDESNPEDSLYYSTFEAYKSRVAQSVVDTSTYKAYGYTDERIEVEIIKNQRKIDEIYFSAI